MIQTFNYRIDGSLPELKVRIWQHDWLRFTKALLWSAACAVLAYRCLRLSGTLPLIGLFASGAACLVGLFVANYAVQWNTLWLMPDVLRLRIVRLFTRTTRAFPRSRVREFGFGFFSHNGPVLKLDVDGTWYVLASEVRSDEVEQLLSKIRERGYSPPVESDLPKADAAPNIRTLE